MKTRNFDIISRIGFISHYQLPGLGALCNKKKNNEICANKYTQYAITFFFIKFVLGIYMVINLEKALLLKKLVYELVVFIFIL